MTLITLHTDIEIPDTAWSYDVERARNALRNAAREFEKVLEQEVRDRV